MMPAEMTDEVKHLKLGRNVLRVGVAGLLFTSFLVGKEGHEVLLWAFVLGIGMILEIHGIERMLRVYAFLSRDLPRTGS